MSYGRDNYEPRPTGRLSGSRGCSSVLPLAICALAMVVGILIVTTVFFGFPPAQGSGAAPPPWSGAQGPPGAVALSPGQTAAPGPSTASARGPASAQR